MWLCGRQSQRTMSSHPAWSQQKQSFHDFLQFPGLLQMCYNICTCVIHMNLYEHWKLGGFLVVFGGACLDFVLFCFASFLFLLFETESYGVAQARQPRLGLSLLHSILHVPPRLASGSFKRVKVDCAQLAGTSRPGTWGPAGFRQRDSSGCICKGFLARPSMWQEASPPWSPR